MKIKFNKTGTHNGTDSKMKPKESDIEKINNAFLDCAVNI